MQSKGVDELARKERNRIAAKKCRLKRKYQYKQIEETLNALQQEHTRLLQQKQLLKGTLQHVLKEVSILKDCVGSLDTTSADLSNADLSFLSQDLLQQGGPPNLQQNCGNLSGNADQSARSSAQQQSSPFQQQMLQQYFNAQSAAQSIPSSRMQPALMQSSAGWLGGEAQYESFESGQHEAVKLSGQQCALHGSSYAFQLQSQQLAANVSNSPSEDATSYQPNGAYSEQQPVILGEMAKNHGSVQSLSLPYETAPMLRDPSDFEAFFDCDLRNCPGLNRDSSVAFDDAFK